MAFQVDGLVREPYRVSPWESYSYGALRGRGTPQAVPVGWAAWPEKRLSFSTWYLDGGRCPTNPAQYPPQAISLRRPSTVASRYTTGRTQTPSAPARPHSASNDGFPIPLNQGHRCAVSCDSSELHGVFRLPTLAPGLHLTKLSTPSGGPDKNVSNCHIGRGPKCFRVVVLALADGTRSSVHKKCYDLAKCAWSGMWAQRLHSPMFKFGQARSTPVLRKLPPVELKPFVCLRRVFGADRKT